MRLELLNDQGEVLVSANAEGTWHDHGPVIYEGDTSLLEWCKSPAPSAMVYLFFSNAARKHGLKRGGDERPIFGMLLDP